MTTLPTKLTVDLDRFTLGSGYWLHTSIVLDPLKTYPPELEPSLLIKLSTTSQPDALARVCTRFDLETYPEPETVLPYNLGLYELAGSSIQAALASSSPPLVGDVVDITPPDIWQHIPGFSFFTSTIRALNFYGTSILLNDPMPTFFTDLSYVISRGMVLMATGTDAIARRYNLYGDLYVRVKEDYTQFEDLSLAINKLGAIQVQAQGLVSDYERAGTEFEGWDEETYT